MIGLLKYGSGMPFNRLEGLQGDLGIPLPASTQWDIIHAKAEKITPALEELIRQAAQGEVLHNDDTTVKILEFMGARAKEQVLAEEAAEDSAEKETSDRRGMFTSGVVSAKEGRKIALFFSGRKHAGENLADVLAERSQTLAAPIQMCDALTRNLPAELETIVAHCLAHGRRRFVEVADRFPEQCRLRAGVVGGGLSQRRHRAPAEVVALGAAALSSNGERPGDGGTSRLAWPAVGGPAGGAELVVGRGDFVHAEALGATDAILRVPGAPLDNNVCERALKRAILHRKNALFYKTRRGAHVGRLVYEPDPHLPIVSSEPFDYLTELERHADDLSANPERWMPWNYRETLARDRRALRCLLIPPRCRRRLGTLQKFFTAAARTPCTHQSMKVSFAFLTSSQGERFTNGGHHTIGISTSVKEAGTENT